MADIVIRGVDQTTGRERSVGPTDNIVRSDLSNILTARQSLMLPRGWPSSLWRPNITGTIVGNDWVYPRATALADFNLPLTSTVVTVPLAAGAYTQYGPRVQIQSGGGAGSCLVKGTNLGPLNQVAPICLPRAVFKVAFNNFHSTQTNLVIFGLGATALANLDQTVPYVVIQCDSGNPGTNWIIYRRVGAVVKSGVDTGITPVDDVPLFFVIEYLSTTSLKVSLHDAAGVEVFTTTFTGAGEVPIPLGAEFTPFFVFQSNGPIGGAEGYFYGAGLDCNG